MGVASRGNLFTSRAMPAPSDSDMGVGQGTVTIRHLFERDRFSELVVCVA
jgi:hypothetical protein